jgi:pimeloyl-ACP methyl ester carboxylesterase
MIPGYTLRGVTLNHERRGSGPPLVLMHGIGSQWPAWEPVLDRLAAERDVIALDLPGFGESPPLPSGVTPTVAALADSVMELLEQLEVSRPHAAGNSMGGWIALELARRGVVASATALSPAGFWNRREMAYSRASLRFTFRLARALDPVADRLTASAAVRTLLFGQVVARPWRIPAPEAASALRAFARSSAFDATLTVLTAGHFTGGAEIAVPVTIAWGERDRLLIPRQARRAVRAISPARLVILERCGHVPMSDDPERVAQVLLEGSAAREGSP